MKKANLDALEIARLAKIKGDVRRAAVASQGMIANKVIQSERKARVLYNLYKK